MPRFHKLVTISYGEKTFNLKIQEDSAPPQIDVAIRNRLGLSNDAQVFLTDSDGAVCPIDASLDTGAYTLSVSGEEEKSATEEKTKPELIYFNGEGRAELTRLVFAAGKVAFTDTRVSDWPSLKADPSSVPGQLFKSMPVLKDGAHLVGKSIAIALYAAELGIYTDGRLGTGLQAAQNRSIDFTVCTTNEDMRGAMYRCLFGNDASKAAGKAALPAAVELEFGALERMLARKTTKGPFFFSQQGPSVADLAVFNNIESAFPGLKKLGADLSSYPLLLAVSDAVAADPAVKAYLKA